MFLTIKIIKLFKFSFGSSTFLNIVALAPFMIPTHKLSTFIAFILFFILSQDEICYKYLVVPRESKTSMKENSKPS